MKVVIIEDEDRAANRLEKMLIEIDASISVVAKLESVEESIEFLNNHDDFDLVFSDIQLADGLCFEIYDQVTIKCPIIFTTAFDNYAIQAFETNGVGYLLKPIKKEKLEAAIHKATQMSTSASSIPAELALVAQFLKEKSQVFKKRFLVKVGDKINTISTGDILTFYSFEKSTFLLTKEGRKFIVDYPLDQLVKLLDPKVFFKINRKYILSIDACHKIIAHTNSRLKVDIDKLKGERIIVAREKVSEFKNWLDA